MDFAAIWASVLELLTGEGGFVAVFTSFIQTLLAGLGV